MAGRVRARGLLSGFVDPIQTADGGRRPDRDGGLVVRRMMHARGSVAARLTAHAGGRAREPFDHCVPPASIAPHGAPAAPSARRGINA